MINSCLILPFASSQDYNFTSLYLSTLWLNWYACTCLLIPLTTWLVRGSVVFDHRKDRVPLMWVELSLMYNNHENRQNEPTTRKAIQIRYLRTVYGLIRFNEPLLLLINIIVAPIHSPIFWSHSEFATIIWFACPPPPRHNHIHGTNNRVLLFSPR